MTHTHPKRPVNKWLALLTCAVFAVPLSHFVTVTFPKIAELELSAYDDHMKALPRLKPDPRLVLVGMDDPSLADLFALRLIDRPAYTRKMQAGLVRKLHEAGAKVIVFDVYFTEPAPEQETQAFAAALRESGKVVVALKSEEIHDPQSGTTTVRFTEPVPEIRPYVKAGSILFPRPTGTARWFVPWPTDTETTNRYLHLSVAAVSSYFGEADQEKVQRTSYFQLGRIRAPFIGEADNGQGNIALHFAGLPYTFVANPDRLDPKTGLPIRTPDCYIPYEKVYTGEWKRLRGAEFFRGKLVLVGRVSLNEDRVQTPTGDMPGVEVEATAMQNLLQSDWRWHWPWSIQIPVKLLLCAGIVVCVWRLSLLWAGIYAVVASIAWIGIANWLFGMRIWVDTVDPLLAIGLTFAAASAIEAWKTRDVFNRFVPSQIAGDILRSPDAGATDREVAIVFCDVRNYTQLSETLAPEEAEAMLHAYFVAGEAAADRLGGVLDKFVGDEMMLYFEPKRGREPHILRAVRWALAMQERAAEMDVSGVAGEIGFHIGIGISAGKVRFGRVRARQRLQHTVIGDAVNLASRLQTATKEVQRGIVLSESAYREVADRVDAELIGSISVKGKQEPQTIYYPIRVKD